MVSALMIGVVGSALIVMSAAPQARRSNAQLKCESGVLDAGDGGKNVLVYELCRERMTVGFESSDVVEQISCKPNGDIQLWLLADRARCEGKRASADDEVYELWEPLRGVGRATEAPVRQLLTCRIGVSNRATIVVPDARDAILETRTGDTKYERLSRRFISRCIRPNA
jgi:hypothetical protein